MIRVSVELDRTTVKVCRQNRLCDSAQFGKRCEFLGEAGDSVLRTERERSDFLFFVPATGHAAEGQRSAHQLKPATARKTVTVIVGGGAKIPIDRFVELCGVLVRIRIEQFDCFVSARFVHVWMLQVVSCRERNASSG